MKRKIRKLKNNPKLFFLDMYRKRSQKISNHIANIGFGSRVRHNGNNRFTVVSAVYNVGRYLDDYFASLTNQALDFEKHIHVIIVDDGSVDNSAQIVERWRKKYPNNIEYIFKENGGQASARNAGLKFVKTEWVTFIDPDDFLNQEFFLAVDNFLRENQDRDFKMLACNLVFFHEHKGTYGDTHPLRCHFSNGNQILKHNNLNKNFQLSASSSIFSMADIKNQDLQFDTGIRPNFEDGLFIALFLLGLRDGFVGFLKEPIYYYRKRQDGSSTLDSSWAHPGRYDTVLKNGYLRVLRAYKEKTGVVPLSLQRTILYDLIWYLKRIVNNSEVVSFLSANAREVFERMIGEIFQYIDRKTILDFELAGCWFYHKVGMLGRFKNSSPEYQIAYVQAFDRRKSQVQLLYFCAKPELEVVTLNGIEQVPRFTKTIRHDFISSPFVYERRLWIELPQDGNLLRLDLGGKPSRITLASKQYREEIKIEDILSHFSTNGVVSDADDEFCDAWLLMDRDTQADDNAEHLYRYLLKTHPDRNAYFVLRRNSHDWPRLQNENFRLIEFGSKQHKKALQNCDKLISSHADVYVTDYLGHEMLKHKDFVFLQHGVTKDDISGWLNKKNKIDCIITASRFEYDSIVGDGSRYKYGRKEVSLTGFPRHDGLLSGIDDRKIILIMPTWRKNIVGMSPPGSGVRSINSDFSRSQYCISWRELLQSGQLLELSRNHGYRIVFFPHANVDPYISDFGLPSAYEVLRHSTSSIQNLLKSASLLITDYSSIAFDMAIQGKVTIYYQFDEAEIFSGAHTYAKGYFDYRLHGFGPVATRAEEALRELEQVLLDGCRPTAEIQARIEATFPFRDGRNCERTYQAIAALDQPDEGAQPSPAALRAYAEHADMCRAWPIAERRWHTVVESGGADVPARHAQMRALREQGKLSEARRTFDALAKSMRPAGVEHRRQHAELLMAMHEWEAAGHIWRELLGHSAMALTGLFACYGMLHDERKASKALASAQITRLSPHLAQLCRAWTAAARGAWQDVVRELAAVLPCFDAQGLWESKPQLLLSRAFRKMGQYESAHAQLMAYETHTPNDPACRAEIARLAFARGNWGKVVSQLELAFPRQEDMPRDLALPYISALRRSGEPHLARDALQSMLLPKGENLSLRMERAEIAMACKQWDEAVAAWQLLLHETATAPLCLAQALEAKGEAGQALDVLMAPGMWRPWAHDDWLLIARLGQKTGRWDEIFARGGTDDGMPDSIRLACALADLDRRKAWPELIAALAGRMTWTDEAERKLFKFEILLARAYREVGDFDAAHAQLAAYDRHSPSDLECGREIVILAWARKSWRTVVTRLEADFPAAAHMPEDLSCIYMEALLAQDMVEKAGIALPSLVATHSDCLMLRRFEAELALVQKNWDRAVFLWREMLGKFDVAPYRLAHAYRMTGKLEKAMTILRSAGVRAPRTAQEWLLRAELAQLTEDWNEAAAGWAALLRFHADEAPPYSWSQLNASTMLNALREMKKKANTAMER